MKQIYVLLTLLLLPTLSNAAFIEGLEDVPVMEGLSQTQNDSISFGNEESRLVEAVLASESTHFHQVEKFYANTLPQMGWIYQGKREKTLIFEREGEIIEINEEQKKPLLVRITVKSKI